MSSFSDVTIDMYFAASGNLQIAASSRKFLHNAIYIDAKM